jgi:hypothetical protein
MKYIYTIIFLAIILNDVFSQDSQESIGLTPKVFKKVLNQQFSNLITGQSQNSIGNFASLDLKESEVSFAGNSIFKDGSLLSVKASGAITDGFYSIFSNSKLNSKVSLDFQYNFFGLRRKSLQIDTDSLIQFHDKIDKIEYKYKVKKLLIDSKQDSLILVTNQKKIYNRINKIDSLLKISNQSQDKIDQLTLEKSKIQIRLDSIKMAFRKLPNKLNQIRNLRNWKIKQEESVSIETAIEGFKFGWVSIGYKVKNNSFKLFDPTLTFKNQIVKTNFVSHELRIQYSKYNWTPVEYESYFWDIGIAFKYTDNFDSDSLSKKEITEVTEYGENKGDRSITSKYNVYQGHYIRGLKQLRFYGDFYYFLFANNIAAFHVYPEWKIQKGEKPIANLGTGFLISLKDSKTKGSVVNAELYYNFLDLFKSSETTYKFFERNNIGIRFAFPLTFKQ